MDAEQWIERLLQAVVEWEEAAMDGARKLWFGAVGRWLGEERGPHRDWQHVERNGR